jgi:hypothetical protein
LHLIIVVELFSQRDVSLGEETSPETHLFPVRSALETKAPNPSVSFCDRPLIFWAPTVRTIFCTLIFLSQLHELWS